jgi:hypothetical protein
MKHMQSRTIGIGVDGHRPQPHLPAGANHSKRDLAAIRNQDFLYGPSQAAILPQYPYQPGIASLERFL